MQTMNTDQQSYYPNPAGPLQGTAGFYGPSGLDYSIRNIGPYTQPMQIPPQVITHYNFSFYLYRKYLVLCESLWATNNFGSTKFFTECGAVFSTK